MRSYLITSALTIALGLATPTGNTIASLEPELVSSGNSKLLLTEEESTILNYLKDDSKTIELRFQYLLEQLRKSPSYEEGPNSSTINEFMKNFLNSNPNTIVIYPLELDEKTLIVWAIRDSSSRGYKTSSAECSIKKYKLKESIDRFIKIARLKRIELEDDFNSINSQIYGCLIKPVEFDMNRILDQSKNSTPNLVFIPDRETYALPISLLSDGNQNLIEKFNVYKLSPFSKSRFIKSTDHYYQY